MPGNSNVAPMDRQQASNQPKMATDAASGVEYTRVIGDDSITMTGTGTSLLSSRLADGRPNAGPIMDPGLLF
jgi:hypothetical protein